MNHNAIGALAKHAIMLTLAINDDKHGEKWRTNDDAEDIRHIIAHIGAYKLGDRSEPHIEHSLTRLAFILARLEIARGNASDTAGNKTEVPGTPAGRQKTT